MSDHSKLESFLLDQSRLCLRPPVVRFAHPWIAPMPLSPDGAAFLCAHGIPPTPPTSHSPDPGAASSPNADGPLDVFNTGDYSLGLFHHDASEAAIELLEHDEFLPACRGALLNMLDNMRSDGLVHRVELAHKSHEDEPAKPIVAQFALRCANAGYDGADWLTDHAVYDRAALFLDYLESNYMGKHGLILAHSALQTGFDNDLLTVSLPDKSIEDPGMSAFMVLEYRAMHDMAQMLGLDEEASMWTHKADRMAFLMNELMWFDAGDGTGYYIALQWKHGVAHLAGEIVCDRAGNQLDPIHTWVSLLPLYAGVPSPERAEKMIALLTDEKRYWGPAGVRTLPLDSVYFNQSPRSLIYDYKVRTRTAVSNWQGPAWVLSNYYLAHGLANYERSDLASELTRRTIACLESDHKKTGSLHECYNDAGFGLWPASGGFVSWNVLALTMLRRYASD